MSKPHLQPKMGFPLLRSFDSWYTQVCGKLCGFMWWWVVLSLSLFLEKREPVGKGRV
jgi:hypothetical protein